MTYDGQVAFFSSALPHRPRLSFPSSLLNRAIVGLAVRPLQCVWCLSATLIWLRHVVIESLSDVGSVNSLHEQKIDDTGKARLSPSKSPTLSSASTMRSSTPSQSQPHGRHSAIHLFPSSSSGDESDYENDQRAAGLTEIAGPPPEQERDSTGAWRRDEGLEEAERRVHNVEGARPNTRSPAKSRSQPQPRSHLDSIHNAEQPSHSDSGEDSGDDSDYEDDQRAAGLTEVAGPPPEQEKDSTGSWRRDQGLEDAEQRVHDVEGARPWRPNKVLTQLYTLSYLIFFAIWGTLARLGLQWLTFFPNAPVTVSNLWANFSGSILLGFISEDQKLFQQEWGRQIEAEHHHHHHHASTSLTPHLHHSERSAAHVKARMAIPLFVGLTTGFCGSFTSFSTFMKDVFNALDDNLPDPNSLASSEIAHLDPTIHHNNGYSFESIMAIFLLTIGMSLFGLRIGGQLAFGAQKWTPILPYHYVRHVIDPIFVFLGFGCWLGAVIMSIWPPDRIGGPAADGSQPDSWRGTVLFAIVFAPLGCLLRYYISLKLNPVVPWFPLGTFAVNMFGTSILAMCFDIQRVRIGYPALIGGGHIGCQVLQGVEDGFCGALTTVSTWANEINSLRKWHGWFYAIASVLCALALVVVILGSVVWSVGFAQPMCTTGRTSSAT